MDFLFKLEGIDPSTVPTIDTFVNSYCIEPFCSEQIPDVVNCFDKLMDTEELEVACILLNRIAITAETEQASYFFDFSFHLLHEYARNVVPSFLDYFCILLQQDCFFVPFLAPYLKDVILQIIIAPTKTLDRFLRTILSYTHLIVPSNANSLPTPFTHFFHNSKLHQFLPYLFLNWDINPNFISTLKSVTIQSENVSKYIACAWTNLLSHSSSFNGFSFLDDTVLKYFQKILVLFPFEGAELISHGLKFEIILHHVKFFNFDGIMEKFPTESNVEQQSLINLFSTLIEYNFLREASLVFFHVLKNYDSMAFAVQVSFLEQLQSIIPILSDNQFLELSTFHGDLILEALHTINFNLTLLSYYSRLGQLDEESAISYLNNEDSSFFDLAQILVKLLDEPFQNIIKSLIKQIEY